MFLDRLLRFLPGGAYAEALERYNRGDFQRARDLLRTYVDAPDSRFREKAAFHLCEACIQLGDQHAERGRHREAAASYEEALAIHPEYADIHNKLGEMRLALGERALAITCFRNAIACNSRFYKAQLNLIRALAADPDPAAAIDALLALQRQCPPLLREKAAALYRECQRADLATIRAALEAFVQVGPDEFELRKSQALEAIQRDDNGRAIALLVELLQRHGDYADLHHLLGLAYGNAGMLDDAILEFERALELNPRFVKARINLGVSLLEQNRVDEAWEQLRRAAEDEPANPLVLNALKEVAALTEARACRS